MNTCEEKKADLEKAESPKPIIDQKEQASHGRSCLKIAKQCASYAGDTKIAGDSSNRSQLRWTGFSG